jgi:hypothetical protein
MSDSPKPTKSDVLLNLLIFTGAMMVILAIPTGLEIALVVRYSETRVDWYWAVVSGAVVAIATALVGCIFLGLAAFIEKKRRNRRQPSDGN